MPAVKGRGYGLRPCPPREAKKHTPPGFRRTLRALPTPACDRFAAPLLTRGPEIVRGPRLAGFPPLNRA